jgi:outer membrane receptor protein involved in Fe transport
MTSAHGLHALPHHAQLRIPSSYLPVGRLAVSAIVIFLAGALNAQVPVAAPGPKKDVVRLEPFQVVSDPDNSYSAETITSLSGINQPLETLPISAEIFNATRLSDLAETDVVDLLNNYATGVGQSFASSTATGTQGGDRYGMSSFNIRGLPAGAIRRNGFLTANNLSEMFEADRVEIINGPQSLLFGTNPAGGVVNEVTKKANFGKKFFSPSYRIDSYGSKRFQADGNWSADWRDHHFAIRVAALQDRNYFYRAITERDSKAIYADVAAELFRPKNTILRFTAEEINGFSYDTTPQVKVFGIPSVVPNNSTLSVLLATNPAAISQIANGYITLKTVDTLAGYAAQTNRRHQYYEATLSSDITSWLKGAFVASKQPVLTKRDSPSATTALSAPLTNGNPLNAWAIGYRPAGLQQEQINEGLRALFTANFDIRKIVTNTVVVGAALVDNPGWQISQAYYQVDSAGKFIVNPANLNNADGGRTLMPVQWVDVQQNQKGYTTMFQPSYTINGVTYVRDFSKYPNPAFAAPGNPLGYNGGSAGVSLTNQISRSVFGTLSSSWFSGALDTLGGIRYDRLAIEQKATGSAVLGHGVTGNAGFVWHFSRPISLYAGYSSNFTPGSFNFASNLTGGLLPNGRGVGEEGGFKFHFLNDRITGVATVYQSKATSNSAVLAAAVQTATDPSGINGRYYTTFANPSITYDSKSTGGSLSVVAQPTRNWRLQAGYSYANGKLGNAVYVPFLYNDEFNVNAAGQVTVGKNGPVLSVPISTTTVPALSYSAGVATEPLTVAILKNGDAGGHYKAALDPTNGRITNASAVGLNLPGVGTGEVGLPISAHQLGFISPLGAQYLAQSGGDRTQGYPEHSVTLGTNYTFSETRLKGVSLGLNVSRNMGMTLYYYVDAAHANNRVLLKAPDSTLVNVSLGYERNVTRKIRWKTQLNVNNVFDDRAYALYPNVASGTYDNALMRNNPIVWIWSNTLTF